MNVALKLINSRDLRDSKSKKWRRSAEINRNRRPDPSINSAAEVALGEEENRKFSFSV